MSSIQEQIQEVNREIRHLKNERQHLRRALEKQNRVDQRSSATCYVLSVGVLPGGARESEHAILNTWDEVIRTLVTILSSNMGVYLTAWYGRKFELRVFKKGVLVGTYNPKEWITFPVIHDIQNARFEADEYGALTCRRQLEKGFNHKLMDSREEPKVEGTTITHSLYTIKLQVPVLPPEHLLVGDAALGTTIQLPEGNVDFPWSSWE